MSRMGVPARYMAMCVKAPWPVTSPTPQTFSPARLRPSTSSSTPDNGTHPFFFKGFRGELRRLGLLQGEQPVGGLDHGHLDPEAPEGLCQFQTYGPTAEDHQAFRQGGSFDRVLVCPMGGTG